MYEEGHSNPRGSGITWLICSLEGLRARHPPKISVQKYLLRFDWTQIGVNFKSNLIFQSSREEILDVHSASETLTDLSKCTVYRAQRADIHVQSSWPSVVRFFLGEMNGRSSCSPIFFLHSPSLPPFTRINCGIMVNGGVIMTGLNIVRLVCTTLWSLALTTFRVDQDIPVKEMNSYSCQDIINRLPPKLDEEVIFRKKREDQTPIMIRAIVNNRGSLPVNLFVLRIVQYLFSSSQLA